MNHTNNKLEQLRNMTVVVADTGDIDSIRRLKPVDATTNPSLLLKAAKSGQYQSLIDQAMQSARGSGDDVEAVIEHLSVLAGLEILQVIPGRISTEVNARHSYDVQQTIDAALRLIDLYANHDVPSDRVLIKIAATWEGIRAAEQLERRNIQCNLTLLFSFEQARACADAGVFLISPFVGRITDWHKAQSGISAYHPSDDPGVRSVQRIFHHYKQHGYETVVMGASFRNAGQVEALAGCDRLTISPQLLDELAQDTGNLVLALDANASKAAGDSGTQETPISATEFESALASDAMASEKLSDGIRLFDADTQQLAKLLGELQLTT